ncbi:putative Endonuclease/exonuclease/phosphatase [Seiridium unicorne]|uniref:Endonuclease/exonuclease/phosphatase n=1 Tax=Seiridium unicorne TaxID=138068 RepID=A0ABR2V3U5_9PEZI
MDEIVQKAIAHNEASRKTSVPWKADEPYSQQHFLFNKTKQEWESQTAASATGETVSPSDSPAIARLALYAWNVDFMLPYAESRMEAALSTLQNLTSQIPSTTAVVIYLQECLQLDLDTISKQPWIRERFAVTDLTGENWASGYYGTTTLVDRRLPITALFRVHYEKTRMERDGLFVDVLMGKARDKKVRLCNSHLESLATMPPYRPPQVEVIARFLKEGGVDAGVAAGDFNAIQDFDRTLHSDNGLKDAYLELGGKEDSDEGYTWGQQAATSLRDQFGCSRMDKVYFTGALELKGFERFGADVQLEDQRQREKLVALGFEKPWITDHLGIRAELQINE